MITAQPTCRRTFCKALVASALLPGATFAEDKLADQKELIEFVTDIMTPGAEGFYKWTSPPVITCVADAVAYKSYVEDFLREVRPAFDGLPVQPALGLDNSAQASIFFALGDDAALRETARKYGDRIQKGGSTWWYNWNEQKHLTTFRIYVDKTYVANMRPEALRWLIYRRLLDALGFKGFSEGLKKAPTVFTPKIWESLRLPSGPPPALTELDLQVIRFAYQSVPNDARKQTVRESVRKNWLSVVLPPRS